MPETSGTSLHSHAATDFPITHPASRVLAVSRQPALAQFTLMSGSSEPHATAGWLREIERQRETEREREH